MKIIDLSGLKIKHTIERRKDRDKRTFYSVQIERYLKRKTQHRFCSPAEKDVIIQIIDDAWDHCCKEIHNISDYSEKVLYCYSCVVIFPYFVAEEESIIPVDFKNKRAVDLNKECVCGSGKPFFECCGTLPDQENPDIGSF